MKQDMYIHQRIQLEVMYFFVYLADLILRVRRVMREYLAKNAILQLRAYKESLAAANDPLTRAYCDFNRNRLKPPAAEDRGVILMDCFPIPVWVAANGILANCLAKREEAQICSYDVSPRVPLVDALYQSFECNTHLLVRLAKAERKKRHRLFIKFVAAIQTKQDLFDLTLGGVQIGDETYETILRQFSKPTVEVNSFKSRYVLFAALNYYLYFENFFALNRVAAVVLSHDIYVSMGILAKIAWKNAVPVYLANGHEMKKTMESKQEYQEFRNYREYFSRLPLDEQENGMEWGRAQLNKRLEGQVGVNMGYSTKSAYTAGAIERQTLSLNKTKIVIATQCFFDNPRAYGGMLFTDFYEWISFLGQISEITDYDWYIKTHRDYLPGTIEALKTLCERWPKIKLIDAEASWHQLKEEGVSVALTCYGSVGHELPLLGYKVINAGYNPHIAYDFNWHPKSIVEYREMLLNLDGLGDIRGLDTMYEFYFVHYNLIKKGGFLFDSFEEMGEYVKRDVRSNQIFEKFVEGDEAFQSKAVRVVEKFLDSGAFSISNLAIMPTRNFKSDADIKNASAKLR